MALTFSATIDPVTLQSTLQQVYRWAGAGAGSRNNYVRNRVGARMQARGEAMILRRISTHDGPVPYPNPPETSDDLAITTAVHTMEGDLFIGIAGRTAVGRLVPGDRLFLASMPGDTPSTILTVVAMPANVQTDTDGLPMLDAGHPGVPLRGSLGPVTTDSLAAGDAWPAIPVSAPGLSDPTPYIGYSVVKMLFAADQQVYGQPLSFQAMTAMGWTEVDTIGLKIAAYNNGPIDPPKINDLLFVHGQKRAIVAVGTNFSGMTNFLYSVQAR